MPGLYSSFFSMEHVFFSRTGYSPFGRAISKMPMIQEVSVNDLAVWDQAAVLSRVNGKNTRLRRLVSLFLMMCLPK
ncbi:MAG: hypothetical protein ACJAVI_003643 [Candidatus Azotimanducaceae bacterium]|jgi:hypothetical protein